MRVAPFLLALPLCAQVSIDAGSASDTVCGGDKATVAGASAPYNTLRQAVAFACAIPVANGTYSVVLNLIEPTATGRGQRLFTVTAGGQVTQIPDLWNYAGARHYMTYPLAGNVAVTAGVLTLDFKASIGLALVAGIEIKPVAVTPPVTPPTLPIVVDPDGAVHIKANVRIDGTLETRSSGPTEWTVTRTDGVVCKIRFAAEQIEWTCPP